LDGFDNSLYPKKINIDGVDYIYDSHSCGCLHDAIKECTSEFNELIDLHLSHNTKKASELIKKMQSDDVEQKVKLITADILMLA
jgi:hypothetical protein